MISYHRNRRDHDLHWKYTWGWRWSNTDDVETISRVMTTFTCSPIVWLDGIRKKDNFLKANWIALDFDTGITLKEVIQRFEIYKCIIGTTKSHGIPKGNEKACDRCRVFIQLNDIIDNSADYEFTMKLYAKEFLSDFAATDAGRKFKPCKEIVYSNKNGIQIEKRKYVGFNSERKISYSRDNIPPYIKEMLMYGVIGGGSRNTACYKIGAKLTECGFSIDEIVDRIMDSQIPISKDASVEKEVRDAVKNGARNAKV